MNLISWIVTSIVSGFLLGLFFFGGLWWTIRRLRHSPTAAVMVFGSFLVRTIVTVTGFYLVSQGNLERILACLVGFLIARAVVVRTQHPVISSPSPVLHSPVPMEKESDANR